MTILCATFALPPVATTPLPAIYFPRVDGSSREMIDGPVMETAFLEELGLWTIYGICGATLGLARLRAQKPLEDDDPSEVL